jgi:hypothetical protein
MKPTPWERLEEARKKREAKAKGDWAVFKVNDNGARVLWRKGLSELEADRLAGYQRDHMPDRDVGQGWTYLPRPFRTPKRPRTVL